MYQHISGNERELIAIWINQNVSIRTIAKRLHRSHATIIREVRRNMSLVRIRLSTVMS